MLVEEEVKAILPIKMAINPNTTMLVGMVVAKAPVVVPVVVAALIFARRWIM